MSFRRISAEYAVLSRDSLNVINPVFQSIQCAGGRATLSGTITDSSVGFFLYRSRDHKCSHSVTSKVTTNSDGSIYPRTAAGRVQRYCLGQGIYPEKELGSCSRLERSKSLTLR